LDDQLFDILRDKQSEGVIEWLPHGLGWTVRDKKRFAAEVLPKHFAKQSKFTSFTRKLNRW
jgi:HSF-type DNA-binding